MNELSSLDVRGKFFVFFNDTYGSGNQSSGNSLLLSIVLATHPVSLHRLQWQRMPINRFKMAFPNATIIPDTAIHSIDDMKEFSDKERELLRKIGGRVYRKYPIGYGNCGLLIAYHFQCPNNSLPILWADGTNNRCKGDDGRVTAYPGRLYSCIAIRPILT